LNLPLIRREIRQIGDYPRQETVRSYARVPAVAKNSRRVRTDIAGGLDGKPGMTSTSHEKIGRKRHLENGKQAERRPGKGSMAARARLTDPKFETFRRAISALAD
jgi:hypothetical protein